MRALNLLVLAALISGVLAATSPARAGTTAVSLNFSPLGEVSRSVAPASAPADISFGPYPLSVFGVVNAINRADKQLTDREPLRFTDGPIAYAVLAIRDWEHRYPRDPWIPQNLFALERVYLHAGSNEGREYAGRVAVWLLEDFPHSVYAERGRRIIANISESNSVERTAEPEPRSAPAKLVPAPATDPWSRFPH